MNDTIAAIATPQGKGGVGIVRISGPQSLSIAQAILEIRPKPRCVVFSKFNDVEGQVIDQGIAVFFKAPHSFTGEDIIELQGHGGPVVMDRLLRVVLQQGARLANPGEFSQRAFLNGKLDLAQAEAVADLINASSEQAAQSAVRSLQGDFSHQIKILLEQLIHLRIQVEAAIDFPEEEIDFIAESTVISDLEKLLQQFEAIKKTTKQGVLLQEGLTIVIAGKPNVGKSSLLNVLSGRESAIVTDIPGTTRDVLQEYIQIDGLPLHIIDTAGLRETGDVVEQEGVRRAQQAMEKANLILFMEDVSEKRTYTALPNKPVVILQNKIDLLSEKPSITKNEGQTVIRLSVKTGDGLNLLETYLKQFAGFEAGEGNFIARRRHLDALERCCHAVKKGLEEMRQKRAAELLAEKLRQAQEALSEITGAFTTDDLLGKIFSTFCIGK